MKGMESVLKADKQNMDLYIEYMDTKRISDELYFQKLYDLYKYKYDRRKLDVILSSDDDAYNFLLKYQDDLFPDVPVVFCGVNYFKDSDLIGHDKMTGVVEAADIKGTLDIALKLHPTTRQIVVVSDETTAGITFRRVVQELIPKLPNSVEFIFLENLNMEEVQERVQNLSPDSFVLLLSFIRDKSGKVFSYEESTALISTASKVPVYSSWDLFLGHGVVGGKMISGYAQGEEAAKMALQILQGEKTVNIPVHEESPNRYMFDYKQMQRFGIKLSSLPKGSIVINRPYSFYIEHKGLVWAITACIGSLIFLVFTLSINVIRRRRAEKELLKAKDELETRVKERTVQLQISNQQLQQEIIERKQAERKLHQQNVYLTTLHETSLALMNRLELNDLLKTIVMRAGALLNTQHGYIRLIDPEEAVMVIKVGVGIYSQFINHRLKWGESLGGKVWQTGQPIVIDDYRTWPDRMPDSRYDIFRAVVGVPLKSGPEVVGVLALAYLEEGRTFGENEIDLLKRFAELASIALDNARLYTSTQQELTKRIQTEQTLAHYTQELERSNQELQDFASIASHDLQEPLRKIIAFGDRLKTLYAGVLDSQGQDYLQRMQNAAKRMQHLIEDLLQYARVTSKAQPFRTTDLKQILQEVLSDLEVRLGQCQGKVEVAELPVIEADALQMRQLFQNLLSNALKFHKPGEVPVVRVGSRPIEGGYYEIYVEDNGIGFDQKYVDRIFKPFQRLQGRHGYEGTGMGLAICQKIVKRHKGEITAHSVSGKGSTFIIRLPAQSPKT